MKVLISAAETSSDAHGAELLKALKQQTGNTVQAFGMGGPHLREAGLSVVVDAREMLVMGFSEIMGRLPRIFRALGQLERAARVERPDLAIVIDYPDFHFRLAKRLRKLGIPVVYYIPPKVWAWRTGRLDKMRSLFSKILCIFPFEEKIYRDAGVSATYVGNPLLDELPFDLSKQDARKKLSIPQDRKTLVLMPGSRPAELKYLFESMLDAAQITSTRLGEKITALMPVPAMADLASLQARFKTWSGAKQARGETLSFELMICSGESALCLVAADVGMIKSGTSTLEAALLGCPHVVVYRASALAAWLFRYVVRFKGPVGLSNLLLEEKPDSSRDPEGRCAIDFGPGRAFRELLAGHAQPERIADEAVALFSDSSRRAEVQAAIKTVRARMFAFRESGAASPSAFAAKEILKGVAHPDERQFYFSLWLMSWVWSRLNAFVQQLVRWGALRPRSLSARVVAVGNLQVGGAGKTPLVVRIAQEAQDRGLLTAILCRGYRGRWEHEGGVLAPEDPMPTPDITGDEPALLHELAPHAWIGVGADRIQQYRELERRAGRPFDLVILDDGFQHWKIKKDLEVLAMTSQQPGFFLFRDQPTSARRADIVVWTKGETRPDVFGQPLVRVRYRLPKPAKDEFVWFVSGVADAASAVKSVRDSGYKVVREIRYADHAAYTRSDVERLLREADGAGCRVAMTGKDWVKWRQWVTRDRVIVLEPELSFEEGRELWLEKLWGPSPSSS